MTEWERPKGLRPGRLTVQWPVRGGYFTDLSLPQAKSLKLMFDDLASIDISYGDYSEALWAGDRRRMDHAAKSYVCAIRRYLRLVETLKRDRWSREISLKRKELLRLFVPVLKKYVVPRDAIEHVENHGRGARTWMGSVNGGLAYSCTRDDETGFGFSITGAHALFVAAAFHRMFQYALIRHFDPKPGDLEAIKSIENAFVEAQKIAELDSAFAMASMLQEYRRRSPFHKHPQLMPVALCAAVSAALTVGEPSSPRFQAVFNDAYVAAMSAETDDCTSYHTMERATFAAIERAA